MRRDGLMRHGPLAVPRRAAFWLLAFAFGATMLGTTLPTPLYVLYQGQWHFSQAITTVIFAVYAAAVMAALLLAGRSSDDAGRKPVLAVALVTGALSTVVFILATGVGILFLGRILSGLSAGLMTGTATAALTELAPVSAGRRASLVATATNIGGLALGPLIAGLFAEYGPRPTVLVFVVYLGLLLVAGACVLLIPETVSHRQRPTLRAVGLAIPGHGRGEFAAAALAGFAAFSVLGLYSALAPAFLGNVLHARSHLLEGFVVFLLFGVGAATQIVVFKLPGRPVVLSGLGLFLAALALLLTALAVASLAVFLVATVVGGVGVGAVFLGSLATANRLAPAERRGQVVSTYFVVCYCGLIIPVIGVGVASGYIGDFASVLAFSILLAAVSLFSFAVIGRSLTPARQHPDGPVSAPNTMEGGSRP